ncbi:hypothetical protein [Corynebacterium durum]|nr:hypothetical protein [Corynebacterium durum]
MITVSQLTRLVERPEDYNLNAVANYANAKGQELQEVLNDLPRHYL